MSKYYLNFTDNIFVQHRLNTGLTFVDFSTSVIEVSIPKVTNELLQEWRGKFLKFSVYSDSPIISRTGSAVTFFRDRGELLA